jgi:hypothetical protein
LLVWGNGPGDARGSSDTPEGTILVREGRLKPRNPHTELRQQLPVHSLTRPAQWLTQHWTRGKARRKVEQSLTPVWCPPGASQPRRRRCTMPPTRLLGRVWQYSTDDVVTPALLGALV